MPCEYCRFKREGRKRQWKRSREFESQMIIHLLVY
jgi:hypothetical protein